MIFCWLTDSLMPARSSLLCNHLDLVILSRTRAGKLNVYQYFSSMFEIYKYISSITGIILLAYRDGCHIALQMLLSFALGCRHGTFRLLWLHFIHVEKESISLGFFWSELEPKIFLFFFSFSFELETLPYTSNTRKEKIAVLALRFKRKQVKFLSMMMGQTPQGCEPLSA